MNNEEAIMIIQAIPNKIWGQLDKCESEAMDMAFKSLEKQIPKEPKYQGEHEKCPTCGSFYIEDYCAMCGQKINRD
jgi:hypothetical protein